MLYLDKCPLFLYTFRIYYVLLPFLYNLINYGGNILNVLLKDFGIKYKVFTPLKCPIKKDMTFSEACCLLHKRTGAVYYIFQYSSLLIFSFFAYHIFTQDMSLQILRFCVARLYPLYTTARLLTSACQLQSVTLWLSFWLFLATYESIPSICVAFLPWADVVDICFLYIMARYSFGKRWIKEIVVYTQEEIIAKKQYCNIKKVVYGVVTKALLDLKLVFARACVL